MGEEEKLDDVELADGIDFHVLKLDSLTLCDHRTVGRPRRAGIY